MANATKQIGPYEAAWNQFVLEIRAWVADIADWINALTTGEKVIGLCLFALALLALMVNQARAKNTPGSNSRQFTVALSLVVIFAFGSGWTLDTGAGSFAHVFGR